MENWLGHQMEHEMEIGVYRIPGYIGFMVKRLVTMACG